MTKQSVARWNAQLEATVERSLKLATVRRDKASIERLTEWLDDLRDRQGGQC